MPDRRVEVELALRDTMTGVLRQTTSAVDELFKKFAVGQVSLTSDSAKLSREVFQLGERTKQSTAHVTGMGTALSTITYAMGGPAGIIAGVGAATVGLAATMQKVSGTSVGQQAFVRDTNLSIDFIKRVELAIQSAGGTIKEADSLLDGVAQKIQRMATETHGEFWQQLAARGQNIDFANRVEDLAKAGKTQEAFIEILRNYEAQTTPTATYYYADLLNAHRSWLREMSAQKLAMWHPYIPSAKDLEVRKQFNDRWIYEANNLWDPLYEKLKQLSISSLLGTVPESGQKPGPTLGMPFGPASAFIAGVVKFSGAQKEVQQNEKQSNWLLGDISDTLHRMWELLTKGGRGVLFRPGIGQRAWRGPNAGAGGLLDDSGKLVDAATMHEVDVLATKGDTEGLQRLFASRGYNVSGPRCGIIAGRYARSAGFALPQDINTAIASNWRRVGQGMDPSEINADDDRMFGSMFAVSKGHTWSGSGPLATGEVGGHVVTIVPHSFDPKTGEFWGVDQHGLRKRWNIRDYETRRHTDEEIKAAKQAIEDRRAGRTRPMDTSTGAAAALAEPDAPPVANPLRRIGISQNNPLNLKYSGSDWQLKNLPGLRPGTTFDQGDRQAAFNSPQSGMNAAAILALRKASRGLTTVRAMIASSTGWTPGYDAAAYNVAGIMGVGPDDQLNFSDPQTLASFLDALQIQEQGKRYYPREMARKAAEKAIGVAAHSTGGADVEGSVGKLRQLGLSHLESQESAAKDFTASLEIKNAPWWLKSSVSSKNIDTLKVTRSNALEAAP